ncbi:MAG TPA: pyridoxamine 5'-phosphate oxidase family protein [Flavobacteriales bacterium]|nr:pyridoxamine 5'-phosphate oxidase family protein [Flavobacteriales bacterium]HMR28873.1 pyridoxamine 5'-phosphate oxidase family protein [Flavobacteriales bacterium]
MARFLPALDERLTAFIRAQRILFTGTAPLNGRMNVSPKGLDTFRVLSPTRVGYLDLTGSGNETAAHLLENGRITFLFCAFEGPPLIVRLYGQGRAVQQHHTEWQALRPHFGLPMQGERQLIIAELESVQTSCGFGIPEFAFRTDRSQLTDRAAHKGLEGLAAYRLEKNSTSIDGAPTGWEG